MKNIETERNYLKERLIVPEHALSALVKENENQKENNRQQVTYSRQKEQRRKTSFEANSITSTSNRFNVLQDEFTDKNEVEFPDREHTTFLHLKNQEMKVRNRVKMKLNFLTENELVSLHLKDQEMKGRNRA